MSKLERWTRPTCYIGKSWPDWYVGLGRHRESGTLDNVNFEVFLEEVTKASDGLSINEPEMANYGRGAEIDSVFVVRESHSLCGWVEWIAIHESDRGALRKARELFDKLNSYPVLDEDRWSETEYEEICTYWKQASLRERAEICKDAGVSIFAARRAEMNEAVYDWLRDGWT